MIKLETDINWVEKKVVALNKNAGDISGIFVLHHYYSLPHEIIQARFWKVFYMKQNLSLCLPWQRK